MELMWKKKKDNIVEGYCEKGKAYIRLSKDGKVDSGYFCFGSPIKFLPDNEKEEKVFDMKERLQVELEMILLSEEIYEKIHK